MHVICATNHLLKLLTSRSHFLFIIYSRHLYSVLLNPSYTIKWGGRGALLAEPLAESISMDIFLMFHFRKICWFRDQVLGLFRPALPCLAYTLKKSTYNHVVLKNSHWYELELSSGIWKDHQNLLRNSIFFKNLQYTSILFTVPNIYFNSPQWKMD